VIDDGDGWLDHHRPSTIVSSIEDHARRIIERDTKMLTLGGDHFIT